MAVNPNDAYPTKTTAPTADYPYGGAQNVTTPGDATGTPWMANLINDIFGFQQALLNAASIVPSGSPDTAVISQYLEALQVLFVSLDTDQTFTGLNVFSKKLTTTDASVSVTSGTYSSAANIITVVLNVASHTVEVGDIIKVSGITNVQVATGGSNVQFNGYVRVTAQTATSVTYEIDTIIGAVGSTALTGTVSFTNGGFYSDSMPKVKNGSIYYPIQPSTAFVSFDGTTTPPTISASFNVSAVVRVSTGVYDVYFKDAMDLSSYVPILASDQVERFPMAFATNKFTFTTRNAASTVTNSANCSVVIFGGRN